MNASLATHHAVLASGASAEWVRRVNALRALRSLAGEDNDALRRSLGAFGASLAVAIGDLRSAVAREACLCVEDMSAAYGPDFAGAAGDALVPALLKASAVTIGFIASSATEAARVLLTHGALGISSRTATFISNSVINVKDAKSPVARAAAAVGLGLLLLEEVFASLPEKTIAIMTEAIKAGCSDPASSVRNTSRFNWRKLEVVDPMRAATLLDRLPDAVQVRILQEKDRALEDEPGLCLKTESADHTTRRFKSTKHDVIDKENAKIQPKPAKRAHPRRLPLGLISSGRPLQTMAESDKLNMPSENPDTGRQRPRLPRRSMAMVQLPREDAAALAHRPPRRSIAAGAFLPPVAPAAAYPELPLQQARSAGATGWPPAVPRVVPKPPVRPPKQPQAFLDSSTSKISSEDIVSHLSKEVGLLREQLAKAEQREARLASMLESRSERMEVVLENMRLSIIPSVEFNAGTNMEISLDRNISFS